MSRTDSAHKLLSLWPGLPDLWRHGNGLALATALVFALAANVLALVTFVWTDLLVVELTWFLGAAGAGVVSGTLKAVGWVVLSCCWLGSAYGGLRQSASKTRPGRAKVDETLFPRAQSEYLKGHWYEAETLAGELLAQRADDIEARLLLATVYRRTGRTVEAEKQLAEMEQFPVAARWSLEMAAERSMLQAAAGEMSHQKAA